MNDFLAQAFAFLAAAVLVVPFTKKWGLGSVFGYILAGSAIGPWGLKLVTEVDGSRHFGELGVVFLLFIIGLELQPSRLWALRKPLFGLGGLQMALTWVGLSCAARLCGLDWMSAGIVGFVLSLSSTAFVLQLLGERRQLTTEAGKSSFAILLFQDLAAIPALALLPWLASSSGPSDPMRAFKGVALIAGLFFFGRYLTRPMLRLVASTRTREVFTAMTLLIVLGVSLLMTTVGLSMALGAFLAGTLLADSEYRHELETDLEPFKGLLLGLFFMSVGMSVNYGLLAGDGARLLLLTLGLIGLKSLLVTVAGRIFGLHREAARNMGFLLSQGGEFAFVLLAESVGRGLLEPALTDRLVLVVTLSMAATPLALWLNERFLIPFYNRRCERERPQFDSVDTRDRDNPVIIAGFGRWGQVFGRVLQSQGIAFTALDHDPQHIEVVRRFGNKVYYGDASRVELLETAGAGKARALVLAIDDVETSLRAARAAKENFPALKIYARARNRNHLFDLQEIGVHALRRETFDASLNLTETLLRDLGFDAERAAHVCRKFRAHDESMLVEQSRLRHDEKGYIAATSDHARQLAELFRKDANSSAQEPPDSGASPG
jgi:monovalent cation:proton antiporter-2 (CPA2) family protein